jgi:hypothetical protein
MSDAGYLKCACSKCGGHIEFPAAGLGETIDCPLCGAPTSLIALPPAVGRTPETKQIQPGRKYFTTIGSILFIVVLAAVGAFFLSAKRFPAGPPPVAKPAVLMPTDPVPQTLFTRLNDFNVGPVTLKKTEGSSLVYAVGSVQNDSDRQRFGVRIQLDLLDANAGKVGSASDYISVIEPHKDWWFKALLTESKVVTAKPAAIEEQK